MKKSELGPGQCGSVGWVLSRKVKGYWVNSWSGHMPRLWLPSPVRARGRGNPSMFLSCIEVFLLFLPPFPSYSKKEKKSELDRNVHRPFHLEHHREDCSLFLHPCPLRWSRSLCVCTIHLLEAGSLYAQVASFLSSFPFPSLSFYCFPPFFLVFCGTQLSKGPIAVKLHPYTAAVTVQKKLPIN